MKFLLFDFDGVLVDSFQVGYETMLKTSPKAFSTEEYRAFFHGNIYDSTAELKEDQTPITDDHPYFKIYTPALLQVNPISDIHETLKRLSRDGFRKMAIISSNLSSSIELYLKKYDLRHFFSAIYGADVHRSKVLKIQMALEAFGATMDESIFITDTLGDVREASKVGLRSIVVPWGFHSLETLQQGNPVAIANTPGELVEIIEAGR